MKADMSAALTQALHKQGLTPRHTRLWTTTDLSTGKGQEKKYALVNWRIKQPESTHEI